MLFYLDLTERLLSQSSLTPAPPICKNQSVEYNLCKLPFVICGIPAKSNVSFPTYLHGHWRIFAPHLALTSPFFRTHCEPTCRHIYHRPSGAPGRCRGGGFGHGAVRQAEPDSEEPRGES